jgi:rhamnose transport system permease protein
MTALHRTEVSVALAIVTLGAVLALQAPGYFAAGNLVDVSMASVSVLVVAVGMTMVMLAGEIDISVASVFAITGALAGALAAAGVPLALACLSAPIVGGLLGAVNGALIARWRIPSIVATLATMVALRDGWRWLTQGAWVQNLPAGFQWFGLSQPAYPVAAGAIAALVAAAAAFWLSRVAGGRAVVATGSNAEAARLAGINVPAVKFWLFVSSGALTGLAALLNAARFNQIPANAGVGLEMKVIAAVLVGGTAVTGGRGTMAGTILGVILLGAIGPALTFLGASAYWERAIQGAIILTAVGADAVRARRARGRRSRPARGVRVAA